MGDLDLFTAVPAGHGEGAGLPVVVVLHGSSASAAQLRGFGLGRFVTAAVEAGDAALRAGRAPTTGPRAGSRAETSTLSGCCVTSCPRWLAAAGLRRRPAGAVGLVARGLRRPAVRRRGARLGSGPGPLQPGPRAGRPRAPRPRRPGTTSPGACGAGSGTRSATGRSPSPTPRPSPRTRGSAATAATPGPTGTAHTLEMLDRLAREL